MDSGNETDHQALLELKAKITGDPLGVMPLWNNSVQFCQWYGVTCSRRRQRVTNLQLPSLKLMGALSPFIGNLSFLRVLNLQNNSFSHAIPREIGHLYRLRVLGLNNNSFVGELPANISSCSKLEIFNVESNLLEGEIPGIIGSLSYLKELDFGNNNFNGGIPHSFGNLSALEIIILSENRLSGRIPEALGQLINLTLFGLFENEISGNIPSSIFNLSNIRVLDFGLNQLQGNLPSDLRINMPYLEILSIDCNKLTGSFPVSLSNSSNLSILQVQANKLSGSLPSFEKLDKLSRVMFYGNYFGSGGVSDLSFLCSLTNATSLQYFSIAENNFRGILPECIGNFSVSLIGLAIGHNKIFGRIPAGIENLINLEVLSVTSNEFTGSIPHGLGRLQKLKQFYAYINSLSGAIPTSFGNLTMLLSLKLDVNNLQGSIPSDLGRCENLLELGLSFNNLTGSIPSAVIGLSSLSIFLDLSSNQLTGMLPVEVGNLKNLGALYVSSNKLSGVLPQNLGSCVRLEILHLQGNFFQGKIPSSLNSLKALQVLDISRNNISGEIPDFLVGFELLQYLNLSFNDLEGALPTEGVFKNASATFIQGNNKLCGGSPAFHLPRCNLKSSKSRSSNSLRLKLAIVFAILGGILVFSFLLLLSFRKKKKQPTTTNFAENSLLKLSYQSIIKATDGFSSENLVGSGNFGSVFKGILEEGGVVIAVKVFNLLSRGASRSFMVECEALKNIRHRNLVKILTAVSGVDYQGNDFKALVYEFMQKGSLEDWLHPPVGNGINPLTLIQRVNVAANVASALEYLHHQCETPIIHCDLKPSNILLDDEMVAHVGDFGLAKFLTTERSNQSSSLGLRGTIGYAPPGEVYTTSTSFQPLILQILIFRSFLIVEYYLMYNYCFRHELIAEYGLGSEVSTKGDVYSFGILLLEMFTGKRPTDEHFREGLSLHNFVKAGLAEQLDEIIDPILLVNQERLDRQYFQYLNSIFEIGLICSVESPSERLHMIIVAAKLCSIRDKLIRPTRVHR
ncbi:hypothetical protein CCACVL1_30503 [Corchorus capsularis]|uniref:non-specific serine/threonine protein kinase n=1 Tax=Corchorus capsularis TaxID=210143 RepID=A0A1R3FWU8_COCAP|nr:hypothetical protein CCACVL1_30503 [Corchorus capsularis]